jgi:hypothetical protein
MADGGCPKSRWRRRGMGIGGLQPQHDEPLGLRGIDRRNGPQEWACTDNRDFFDPTTGTFEYNAKGKAQRR